MSDRGFRKAAEKLLKSDGWVRDRCNCVHEIFVHPTKKGSVPLPYNAHDRNFLNHILRHQAGIKARL
jgi:predicted RNA binding protein YcfA (HicA-like mRNA interferase family)